MYLWVSLLFSSFSCWDLPIWNADMECRWGIPIRRRSMIASVMLALFKKRLCLSQLGLRVGPYVISWLAATPTSVPTTGPSGFKLSSITLQGCFERGRNEKYLHFSTANCWSAEELGPFPVIDLKISWLPWRNIAIGETKQPISWSCHIKLDRMYLDDDWYKMWIRARVMYRAYTFSLSCHCHFCDWRSVSLLGIDKYTEYDDCTLSYHSIRSHHVICVLHQTIRTQTR